MAKIPGCCHTRLSQARQHTDFPPAGTSLAQGSVAQNWAPQAPRTHQLPQPVPFSLPSLPLACLPACPKHQLLPCSVLTLPMDAIHLLGRKTGHRQQGIHIHIEGAAMHVAEQCFRRETFKITVFCKVSPFFISNHYMENSIVLQCISVPNQETKFNH